MYFVRPCILFIVIGCGAFGSADILSDIPTELFRQLFGNLRVSSYDIDKQEVIEVPAQVEVIPIKFYNEKCPIQPPLQDTLRTTTVSPRRYLPTNKTPERAPPSPIPISSLNEIRRKQMSGNTPKMDSTPVNSTQKDVPVPININDVRSANPTDE